MFHQRVGSKLNVVALSVTVLALACLLLPTAAVEAEEGTIEAAPVMAWESEMVWEAEAVPFRPAFPKEPKPVGLTCSYTCDGDTSINWTLLCSQSTERACCAIADAVCPELVSGSTGTGSCSC